MIEYTKDLPFINMVANDPHVKAGAAPGREHIFDDLSDIVGVSKCLRWKDKGLFLLIPSDEYGGYSVHTMFLPKARHTEVVKAVSEGFYTMFIKDDAMEITTSACSTNEPAVRLSNISGFRLRYYAPSQSVVGATDYFYSIDILDWIFSQKQFEPFGEYFHLLLEGHTNHTDDVMHDRVVGAVFSMFIEGNFEKAVSVYNRWALMTGYVPMLLDEHTQTIHVGEQVIRLGEDMKSILEVH